jgi:hypothetical protein
VRSVQKSRISLVLDCLPILRVLLSTIVKFESFLGVQTSIILGTETEIDWRAQSFLELGFWLQNGSAFDEPSELDAESSTLLSKVFGVEGVR